MSTKPRVFALRAAQVLTASAIAGGGILVAASPAAAATVTSVAVVNSSSKVVSDGSTVAITGTGFSGMTDNDDAGTCVATPAPGCSTVRFIGMNSGNTASIATAPTLATRFTVVSDTLIYAVVPALPVYGNDGAPSVGYGIVGVAVQNGTSVTSPAAFNATTTAATGAGHLIYRHKLTADVAAGHLAGTGGGTLPVTITAPASFALTSGAFTNEKITALFTVIPAGNPTPAAPQVISTTTSFVSGSVVNVLVPAGSPAGEKVSVELVHDGVRGTADVNSVEYAAAITKIETCTASINHTNVAAGTLPTNCTGPASTPATASAEVNVKITGKGFIGATGWDFSGGDNTNPPVVDTCTIASNTVVFCTFDIAAGGAPSPAAVAVDFTPADPDGDLTTPDVGLTAGSIFLFTNTI
jgi:hypothetical protein